MAQRRRLPPIHPGELLRDELNEIGVSLNELGRALRVPMNRISAIVNGNRAITVDTAMRLARYFGTSPQYWLNLQNAYDLEVAGQELGSRIEREVLGSSRDYTVAVAARDDADSGAPSSCSLASPRCFSSLRRIRASIAAKSCLDRPRRCCRRALYIKNLPDFLGGK